MAHTSGSHKPRRCTSTPQDSSRQSNGTTTNDGRTRYENTESPYGDHRSVDGRPVRASYGGSGRKRPTTSSAAIQSPPQSYLPTYPCDLATMGMTAYVRHEPLPQRRPEGARRLSIDFSYGREAETTIRHVCINKRGDEGWLDAIAMPRIVKKDRHHGHGKPRSIPKVTIVNDRRTYDLTPAKRDVRGSKRSRRGEGGPGGFQSHEWMPGIRAEDPQSFTESAERGYGYQQSHQKVSSCPMSREEAATTTRRHEGPTTKRTANDPQGSQVSIYDAHIGPARTESFLEAGDSADRSSHQGYTTRETVTQTHPDDNYPDPVLAHCRNPTTLKPMSTEIEIAHPDVTKRQSSNKKYPSQSRGTDEKNRRRSHRPRRYGGDTYSYENTKTTTTYRPSQSGCCVVL